MDKGATPTDARIAHAHIVRFYDDDDFLLDEARNFIDAALDAGGSALVFATRAHIEVLREGYTWRASRVVFMEAEATLDRLLVDGQPDPALLVRAVDEAVAQASAAGGPVHVFGEAVALMCERGHHEAAAELERLWNGLLAQYDCITLCAYPWRVFPDADSAAAFEQICAHHHHAGMHTPGGAPQAFDGASFDRARLQRNSLALDAEVVRRKQAERALRQREEELADFVENAVEGLHRVGPDGTILWANKAELQMLGYRWEDYVGRHIAEFHVDADVIADILDTLLSGGTLIDRPARLRCKDGSIKHVLIHSNGSFENGKLRFTRCFTRDATERHERDAALARNERLLAELTDANRAKDEFLAMLGHELRNPLAPIVTALQLMRLRGDHSVEHGIIQRQADHLVRLVDDLLDVSRVTRGTIQLQMQRVDIAQMLAKAVEMASTLLEQRRHVLEVDVEPGLSWTGDPVRLAQVVANLLTNAARYTEPGGRVRLCARIDDARQLCISVADNGIGLGPGMHERVFELFFQGKRGIDRAEGGLGLGLALVKNIVELHGGSVQARSEGRGSGSEFIVRLPWRGEDVWLAPALGAPASGAPAAAGAGPRRRILVVDDNADAAALLGRLLAALGHAVEVYHDPLVALEAAGRVKPDIAVLDIGLPRMDGYELATRLRALFGDHPCRLVALSGYGQPADKARSLASGFDLHLVKPITPDQVADLVAARPVP